MQMATRLDRLVIYYEGLLPTNYHDPLIMWSCKIMRDQSKHNISTTKVPMAMKPGRMVTYLDGLLQIKSHDPLII